MKRKGLNFMNNGGRRSGARMIRRDMYALNREQHPTTAHVGTNLEKSIWPKGSVFTINIGVYDYVSRSGLGELSKR